MVSELQADGSQPGAAEDPLAEYKALKRRIYLTTMAIAAAAFAIVLVTYSFNTALSYLVGAASGLLYLRMLDRSVSGIGAAGGKVGSFGRIGVFAAVMILVIKSGTLQILPAFFGFLTVKAAILFDTLRTLYGEGNWAGTRRIGG
ncbi:ATP synthase subunit I [Gloeobacter kilaueensis]|uniref:CGL160/ATPI domain-containing protein n=1 Tax=Gloeobacter kilaueensis (strain ATCC BAA-2537 / CCAP 1431/1 / ULC 316 / JS1) TaxID=1183438 RepID=U5QHY9_GLOK1|nr:ATP synthase subunit I [Gloeobacter kilaueensis]AGY58483.1 hypothetical protein GKIL_2237 [Gloeobacter kilaueensis JS1]